MHWNVLSSNRRKILQKIIWHARLIAVLEGQSTVTEESHGNQESSVIISNLLLLLVIYLQLTVLS